MKTRRLFLGLAAMLAASASFTSCSNEDELGAQSPDGRTPITLTSNIATRTVSTELQETEIAQGVQVGVFVAPTEAGELIADNAQITSDGSGSFTGTIGNYPAGEGATVSIYAYAPYNSAWAGKLNEAQTFTVKTDQTTDNAYLASDLLYGTPKNNQVAASENAVTVQFEHKLTKINLAFNTADTEIDLKGATVSLVDVLTQTTINLSDGTLGTGSQPADINVAEFAEDATQFAASAIIVPQTVAANANFVRVQLADGTTYDANISTSFTFETGKQYTYTATFTENGLELKLISTIEGWQDGAENPSGSTEEKIVYGVGDYITSDGTFIKNSELSDENKGNVVAVIFSTNVSTTDAEAGYDAYAMGLWRVKGKLGFADEVGEQVTSFTAVLADLEGRTKTDALLKSSYYSNLTGDTKAESMLGMLETYRTSHSVNSSVSSAWFIPAIGQQIQLVNNLGGAEINESTEVESGNVNTEWWTSDDAAVIEKINAYITECGQTNPLVVGGNINLASSSEAGVNLWGIQLRGESNTNFISWGFGRGLNKNGNTDTSIIPCVAVKLPEPVSAAE